MASRHEFHRRAWSALLPLLFCELLIRYSSGNVRSFAGRLTSSSSEIWEIASLYNYFVEKLQKTSNFNNEFIQVAIRI